MSFPVALVLFRAEAVGHQSPYGGIECRVEFRRKEIRRCVAAAIAQTFAQRLFQRLGEFATTAGAGRLHLNLDLFQAKLMSLRA